MKARLPIFLVLVMASYHGFSQSYRLYHKQNLFDITNNRVCHYTRQITMKLATMDNPDTKFMDFLYQYGTQKDCYPIVGCFYEEIKQSVVEYNRLGNDTAGGYMVFDHNPVGLKKHATIASCSTDVYGEVQYLSFDYTNYLKKNVVAEVYGYNNHIRYQGDFVCVPESLTAPKILSPNVNGLVTTPEMRFRAPDFLANNFDPLDIEWFSYHESYGNKDGKPNFHYAGSGTEIVHSGIKCKPMQIYAIVRKNKYNWQTSTISFQHSPYPNLELGKTLILTQPKCTDAQSDGDPSKTVAHLSLDKSAFGRKFLLTYTDKNGIIIDQFTLDKEPNDERLLPEESPYRLTIEELYSSGSSCEQYIDSVKIIAPTPISVVKSTFTDIPCYNDRASLQIHIKGGTSVYQLVYGLFFGAQIGNDQSWYVPLLKGNAKYDFSITDQNGCVYDKKIAYVAKEPAQLLATVSFDSVQCHNGVGVVHINATGGTPFDSTNPYRYSFFPNSNVVRLENQFTGAGGMVVYPKVFDKNNCSYVLPAMQINNPKDFRIKVDSIVDNICPKGQQGELYVSGTSGEPNYTYTFGQDLSDFKTDSAFKNLFGGYHKIYAQNNKGCVKDTTVLVREPSPIQIINVEERQVKCQGESNGGFTIKGMGGTGRKEVWHSNSVILTSNKDIVFFQDYDSLSAGDYTFYVKDSLGCVDSASYTLRTLSKLTNTVLLKENPACNESSDGSLRIRNENGIAPYKNEWLDTEANKDTSLTRLGLGKGTYILQAKDAIGCAKLDTFVLIAPPSLQVELKGYPLICKGQSLDMDAGDNGLRYEWSSNNGFVANTRNVTLYFEGTYYVKVTNRSGCVGRDTFLLKQSDVEIRTDFLMPSKAVKGDTVVLLNTDAKIDSIRWGFDDPYYKLVSGNPDFRAQELVFHTEGEHGIEMTSYYKGCRDVRKRTITIIPAHERNNNDRSLGMKVSLVKECSLHPNPNNGDFTVSVDLNEPNIPMELTLASVATGSILKKVISNEYSEHRVTFEEDLPDGAYAVYIKVKNEVFMLRFLVTNE